MSQFNWVCPHCNYPQVGTGNNHDSIDWLAMIGETAIGKIGVRLEAVACLNDKCKQVSLIATLKQQTMKYGNPVLGDDLKDWRLMPESGAKPQPEFIPEALRLDYLEACRIRDLSPKASATLSRRCLQGMIRNFCGIAKGSLDAEIKALKTLIDDDKAPRGVTPESVDAIDQVRSVGNIGAHMERDIDLIIEIDPGEAQLLIELIETLFDEWYIARDTREKRFAGIKALSEEKKNAKKPESL
jgi:hypothetical protein